MDCQVAIIGCGPTGLCLAKSLAVAGLDIVLIDKQDETALSHPAYDGREIALTHRTYRLLRELDVFDSHTEKQISIIKDAQVYNGYFKDPLRFSHTESKKPHLGYIVSNQIIRSAAYKQAIAEGNVSWFLKSSVANIAACKNHITIAHDNGSTIKCKLVIGADGRFSHSRRMMGIATNMKDFGHTCFVGRVEMQQPLQHIASECFFYDMTLALLPLQGNTASVVITLPTSKASGFKHQSATDTEYIIKTHIMSHYGDVHSLGQLYDYPLIATYAQRFYDQRFALVGDAAVGMHPVTAHGFNLGLQGAMSLAQLIISAYKSGSDIGHSNLLRCYNRKHRHATWLLYQGTNAIVHLYNRNTQPARLLRSSLLTFARNNRFFRQRIINKLTGI